jgi:hypothetical protein
VGRLCIELAAKFSTETLGVPMTAKPVICHYCAQSHECIGKNCPYFPKHMNLDITADSNARSVIEAYPQSWEYFRAIGLCCVDAAEGTVSEVCRAHGIEPNSFTQAYACSLFKLRSSDLYRQVKSISILFFVY